MSPGVTFERLAGVRRSLMNNCVPELTWIIAGFVSTGHGIEIPMLVAGVAKKVHVAVMALLEPVISLAKIVAGRAVFETAVTVSPSNWIRPEAMVPVPILPGVPVAVLLWVWVTGLEGEVTEPVDVVKPGLVAGVVVEVVELICVELVPLVLVAVTALLEPVNGKSCAFATRTVPRESTIAAVVIIVFRIIFCCG